MTASMHSTRPRKSRPMRSHVLRRFASLSGALILTGATAFFLAAQAQMAPVPSPVASANAAGAMRAPAVALGVIPPPPLREIADPKRASGQPARLTQAKQQFVNPERAYDPNTGESFYWDCAKKTWFDSKRHVAVGFEGGKTSEGEIIPPPPKLEVPDSERVTSEGLMARITQGKQDADNPARAVDPESKQILVWDYRQRSWIDTKTGEAIGFIGRKALSACQQAGAPAAPPTPAANLAKADVLDDLLFKEHVPISPSQRPVVSSGMGEALLQLELLLTSKQSVIGGPMRFTAPRAEAKPNPAAQNPSASSSACLSCARRETCPSSCPELPSFLQLSKAMLADPL
ncbi:MAG: hypothetical protein JO137_09345 [Hyphomicrobiales bacterium]|nr:hypothetical protein [Hyphomicrobiales bacterium]MBV9432015.1 hypothetical protein [Hyphomicrobiales bacterium]MBV9739606.1 hypothetical protein [Hyphomicrobiales bacterium]